MPWIGRPIDPILLSGISTLVRDELESEVAAGLPKLRRIPSSGIIKFLDYFGSLSIADRTALLDVLAHLGALHFFPGPLIVEAYEQIRAASPALEKMRSTLTAAPFAYGLRYQDLRMSRMSLNDAESMMHMKQTRSALNFVPRDDPPSELVPNPDLRQVQPAKAPLLRRLLNQSVSPLLGVKPTKRPGGEIVYDGSIEGTPLQVRIIFSNMYGQMHYGVTAKLVERNILAQRLTYEVFWGANPGWDYITEENAAPSIELLGDLIHILARMMKQIASLPGSA